MGLKELRERHERAKEKSQKDGSKTPKKTIWDKAFDGEIYPISQCLINSICSIPPNKSNAATILTLKAYALRAVLFFSERVHKLLKESEKAQIYAQNVAERKFNRFQEDAMRVEVAGAISVTAPLMTLVAAFSGAKRISDIGGSQISATIDTLKLLHNTFVKSVYAFNGQRFVMEEPLLLVSEITKNEGLRTNVTVRIGDNFLYNTTHYYFAHKSSVQAIMNPGTTAIYVLLLAMLTKQGNTNQDKISFSSVDVSRELKNQGIAVNATRIKTEIRKGLGILVNSGLLSSFDVNGKVFTATYADTKKRGIPQK